MAQPESDGKPHGFRDATIREICEKAKANIAAVQLDQRAWLLIVRGVLRSLWEIIFVRKPVPSLNPQGGRFGLPADFLIANDGTVVASKYGVHAYDQ